MKIKEKINLDVIRLIAAFMVIAIHTYPFSSFNETFDYLITRVLFRIAVPIFLLITGYYVISKSLKDINVLKNYTKNIIKIYLYSILIFLPINIYNHYFTNNSLIFILKDIFLNGPFYHLWYFPALILGCWLTYFIIKKVKIKPLFIIFIMLYIIGLFGDNYYGLISNTFLKNIYDVIFSITNYTRNGLFYTPIFLYMGYVFNTKQSKISSKNNIIYIILFTILMLMEGYLLYKYNIPRHSSMYIFLIPLMYFIFNYLITNFSGINKTYRSYATWIYILHPFLIVALRLITKLFHLEFIIANSLINYILVIISTILLIYIFNIIKKIILKPTSK